MTTADVASAKRLDFGAVVRQTFGVIGRNLGPFVLGGTLLVGIPSVLIGALQASFSQTAGSVASPFGLTAVLLTFVGLFASLIGGFLLQVAVVQATVADLNGRKAALSAGLGLGLQLFLPLLGLGMIVGILSGLASMLLLVPGLILMVMWSVATPALVVERRGVMASLQRSRDLTRNNRWTIFGLLFVYLAVYLLIYFAMGAVGGALGAGSVLTPTSVTTSVVTLITGVFGAVIGATGVAVIYSELRANKEGVGPEQLASVFD